MKRRDPREYRVSSTSATSADLDDLVIGLDNDDSNRQTRKIARLKVVRHPGEDQSEVKLCICHQRRGLLNEEWEDTDNFNLVRVKSGQEVQMRLKSEHTRKLCEILNDSFRIANQSEIYSGDHRYAVINLDENIVLGGMNREIIRGILQSIESEVFWESVQELGPDLPEAVALRKINQTRQESIDEFSEKLDSEEWDESQWQDFFKNNTWIFGYGLQYQFLQDVQDEPHLGGTDYSGQGEQQSDFLLASAARARFTVIVEIKRPDSDLVFNQQYRNGSHKIGPDLIGGVIQLQQQCIQWEEESKRPQNREQLEEQNIFTHEPKGILVIGNTESVSKLSKRRTFESFRQRITKPEIITFDELLERARFIVHSNPEE
jgi:hypothetical protein